MPNATRRRRISSRRRGLLLAIYESGFATVFTELTGGARQVGFALLLGSRDLQIGLLSALPSLANLSQLTASFLLERTGQRKPFALLAAALSRLIWIGVIVLPLGLFGTLHDLRVWLLVGIVGLSALFAAMSTTFSISMLGDLVPARLRGRYFGRRNMIIAAVGMSVPLLASVWIDAWKTWFGPYNPSAFLLVFGVGIACGLVALAVQWQMPPMRLEPSRGVSFFARLAIPLRDTNFRRFIVFHLCWGSSVSLAGPFFAVYMLKNLHLSYTVITALTSLTALSNLIGMRFWGQMTDRFSAKPVSLLGGLVAASLPGLWLLTAIAPYWAVLPLAHLIGGAGWSAFNLNLNTLILAMAPRQERSIYLSVHAALTGLTTAIAPVLGGLLGKFLQEGHLPLPLGLDPYLAIFALSCLCRLLSLLLFLRVHEPREVPLERLLPVFGNLRTLNTMMGFDPVFQYAYMQGERLDRFVVSHGGDLRRAFEQLDQTTDTYAAQAEAEIADIVDSGERGLRAVQERSNELEQHMDDYVKQSEARVARLLARLTARLAPCWQWFIKWRDRE